MSELLSCVQEWVHRFEKEKGVDTSSWQVRASSETEFAVCRIPSPAVAQEFADSVRAHCAAAVTVVDRHPNLPHWCVMSVATVLTSDEEAESAGHGAP